MVFDDTLTIKCTLTRFLGTSQAIMELPARVTDTLGMDLAEYNTSDEQKSDIVILRVHDSAAGRHRRATSSCPSLEEHQAKKGCRDTPSGEGCTRNGPVAETYTTSCPRYLLCARSKVRHQYGNQNNNEVTAGLSCNARWRLQGRRAIRD